MNISQTKGLQTNEKKGLQVIEYSQRFCDRAGNEAISSILINHENGKTEQVTSWLSKIITIW